MRPSETYAKWPATVLPEGSTAFEGARSRSYRGSTDSTGRSRSGAEKVEAEGRAVLEYATDFILLPVAGGDG